MRYESIHAGVELGPWKREYSESLPDKFAEVCILEILLVVSINILSRDCVIKVDIVTSRACV